jgi:hypothetical protein
LSALYLKSATSSKDRIGGAKQILRALIVVPAIGFLARLIRSSEQAQLLTDLNGATRWLFQDFASCFLDYRDRRFIVTNPTQGWPE